MQINEVVLTWEAVRATRSRTAKTTAVAKLLAEIPSTEASNAGLVVSYLSGDLPQGRIGLGYAAVGAIEATAASESSLQLADLDSTFSQIKAASGAGSKQLCTP